MAKKTAYGAGNIRHRSDGRWEGRVVVGTDPSTGKLIRRSVYAATQRECRRQMTEMQQTIDTGTYQEPSRMTVSEWMAEWLETFARPKVKPLTLAAYDAAIRNHIDPAVGTVKVQDLRGVHVQRLYNGMLTAGKSPKTIKNIGAILHKAMGIAVKQGYLRSNPCDAAELPKVTRAEIKPLSDDEIAAFLRAIQGHRMEALFAVCLFAGLREGEALGLSWGQVDFAAGTLTISQQLQREKKAGGRYYIVPTTKSGKPRIVKPPEVAMRYLRAERTRQAERRLAAGAAWSNPNDLVFTTDDGRYLAIATVYRAFKRIAASIGRPDARPHDLRHTAATVALAAGADLKSVQDMLGHATASFTLSTYAHATDRMREDTADRVQRYYDAL